MEFYNNKSNIRSGLLIDTDEDIDGQGQGVTKRESEKKDRHAYEHTYIQIRGLQGIF